MEIIVRPSKTTKEIENDELEQLKRPEARETAAFDPTELQGLIAQTREDDLAVPVASSSVTAMPTPASSNVTAMSASSNITAMPTTAASSSSNITAMPTTAASSSSNVTAMPASSNVTAMPATAASSSILSPLPNDWDDVPGHYSEVPSSTIPPRMARGSAKTPKASRPLAPRSSSLLPWILVALAAAAVIALALWR